MSNDAINHEEEAKPTGPMAKQAEQRPNNYNELSAAEQWATDKRLGILDWDGDPTK